MYDGIEEVRGKGKGSNLTANVCIWFHICIIFNWSNTITKNQGAKDSKGNFIRIYYIIISMTNTRRLGRYPNLSNDNNYNDNSSSPASHFNELAWLYKREQPGGDTWLE